MQQLEQNSPDNIIDEIIKDNKLKRFASEIQHTNDSNRKQDLREVLRCLEGATTIKFEESAKTKLNKIFDEMDNSTIHNKWSRLSIPQKKDRIKEFLKR